MAAVFSAVEWKFWRNHLEILVVVDAPVHRLPHSGRSRIIFNDAPGSGELTGSRTIPILRHFPARSPAGDAGRPEARRVPMMRDPGKIGRRSEEGRKIVPAGSRRRR